MATPLENLLPTQTPSLPSLPSFNTTRTVSAPRPATEQEVTGGPVQDPDEDASESSYEGNGLGGPGVPINYADPQPLVPGITDAQFRRNDVLDPWVGGDPILRGPVSSSRGVGFDTETPSPYATFLGQQVKAVNVFGRVFTRNQLANMPSGGELLYYMDRKASGERRGFSDAIRESNWTTFLPFVSTVADIGGSIYDATRAGKTFEALQNNEPVTNEDLVRAQAYLMKGEWESTNTRWGTVGDIVKMMPSLAMEYGASSWVMKKGLGALAKTKAGSWVSRQMAANATRNYARANVWALTDALQQLSRGAGDAAKLRATIEGISPSLARKITATAGSGRSSGELLSALVSNGKLTNEGVRAVKKAAFQSVIRKAAQDKGLEELASKAAGRVGKAVSLAKYDEAASMLDDLAGKATTASGKRLFANAANGVREAAKASDSVAMQRIVSETFNSVGVVNTMRDRVFREAVRTYVDDFVTLSLNMNQNGLMRQTLAQTARWARDHALQGLTGWGVNLDTALEASSGKLLKEALGWLLVEAPIKGTLITAIGTGVRMPIGLATAGTLFPMSDQELAIRANAYFTQDQEMMENAFWYALGAQAIEAASESTGPAFGYLGKAIMKSGALGGAGAAVSNRLGSVMRKTIESMCGDGIQNAAKAEQLKQAAIRRLMRDVNKTKKIFGREASFDEVWRNIPMRNKALKEAKKSMSTKALAAMFMQDMLIKASGSSLSPGNLLTPTGLKRMARNVGWHGVLEEWLEERYGGFVSGLMGTEPKSKFEYGEEGRTLKDAVWEAFTGLVPEDGLAELIAFMIPGVANSVAIRAQAALGTGSLSKFNALVERKRQLQNHAQAIVEDVSDQAERDKIVERINAYSRGQMTEEEAAAGVPELDLDALSKNGTGGNIFVGPETVSASVAHDREDFEGANEQAPMSGEEYRELRNDYKEALREYAALLRDVRFNTRMNLPAKLLYKAIGLLNFAMTGNFALVRYDPILSFNQALSGGKEFLLNGARMVQAAEQQAIDEIIASSASAGELRNRVDTARAEKGGRPLSLQETVEVASRHNKDIGERIRQRAEEYVDAAVDQLFRSSMAAEGALRVSLDGDIGDGAARMVSEITSRAREAFANGAKTYDVQYFNADGQSVTETVTPDTIGSVEEAMKKATRVNLAVRYLRLALGGNLRYNVATNHGASRLASLVLSVDEANENANNEVVVYQHMMDAIIASMPSLGPVDVALHHDSLNESLSQKLSNFGMPFRRELLDIAAAFPIDRLEGMSEEELAKSKSWEALTEIALNMKAIHKGNANAVRSIAKQVHRLARLLSSVYAARPATSRWVKGEGADAVSADISVTSDNGDPLMTVKFVDRKGENASEVFVKQGDSWVKRGTTDETLGSVLADAGYELLTPKVVFSPSSSVVFSDALVGVWTLPGLRARLLADPEVQSLGLLNLGGKEGGIKVLSDQSTLDAVRQVVSKFSEDSSAERYFSDERVRDENNAPTDKPLLSLTQAEAHTLQHELNTLEETAQRIMRSAATISDEHGDAAGAYVVHVGAASDANTVVIPFDPRFFSDPSAAVTNEIVLNRVMGYAAPDGGRGLSPYMRSVFRLDDIASTLLQATNEAISAIELTLGQSTSRDPQQEAYRTSLQAFRSEVLAGGKANPRMAAQFITNIIFGYGLHARSRGNQIGHQGAWGYIAEAWVKAHPDLYRMGQHYTASLFSGRAPITLADIAANSESFVQVAERFYAPGVKEWAAGQTFDARSLMEDNPEGFGRIASVAGRMADQEPASAERPSATTASVPTPEAPVVRQTDATVSSAAAEVASFLANFDEANAQKMTAEEALRRVRSSYKGGVSNREAVIEVPTDPEPPMPSAEDTAVAETVETAKIITDRTKMTELGPGALVGVSTVVGKLYPGFVTASPTDALDRLRSDGMARIGVTMTVDDVRLLQAIANMRSRILAGEVSAVNLAEESAKWDSLGTGLSLKDIYTTVTENTRPVKKETSESLAEAENAVDPSLDAEREGSGEEGIDDNAPGDTSPYDFDNMLSLNVSDEWQEVKYLMQSIVPEANGNMAEAVKFFVSGIRANANTKELYDALVGKGGFGGFSKTRFFWTDSNDPFGQEGAATQLIADEKTKPSIRVFLTMLGTMRRDRYNMAMSALTSIVPLAGLAVTREARPGELAAKVELSDSSVTQTSVPYALAANIAGEAIAAVRRQTPWRNIITEWSKPGKAYNPGELFKALGLSTLVKAVRRTAEYDKVSGRIRKDPSGRLDKMIGKTALTRQGAEDLAQELLAIFESASSDVADPLPATALLVTSVGSGIYRGSVDLRPSAVKEAEAEGYAIDASNPVSVKLALERYSRRVLDFDINGLTGFIGQLLSSYSSAFRAGRQTFDGKTTELNKASISIAQRQFVDEILGDKEVQKALLGREFATEELDVAKRFAEWRDGDPMFTHVVSDDTLATGILKGVAETLKDLGASVDKGKTAAHIHFLTYTGDRRTLSTFRVPVSVYRYFAGIVAPTAVTPFTFDVYRKVSQEFNRRMGLDQIEAKRTPVVAAEQVPTSLVYRDASGAEHNPLLVVFISDKATVSSNGENELGFGTNFLASPRGEDSSIQAYEPPGANTSKVHLVSYDKNTGVYEMIKGNFLHVKNGLKYGHEILNSLANVTQRFADESSANVVLTDFDGIKVGPLATKAFTIVDRGDDFARASEGEEVMPAGTRMSGKKLGEVLRSAILANPGMTPEALTEYLTRRFSVELNGRGMELGELMPNFRVTDAGEGEWGMRGTTAHKHRLIVYENAGLSALRTTNLYHEATPEMNASPRNILNDVSTALGMLDASGGKYAEEAHENLVVLNSFADAMVSIVTDPDNSKRIIGGNPELAAKNDIAADDYSVLNETSLALNAVVTKKSKPFTYRLKAILVSPFAKSKGARTVSDAVWTEDDAFYTANSTETSLGRMRANVRDRRVRYGMFLKGASELRRVLAEQYPEDAGTLSSASDRQVAQMALNKMAQFDGVKGRWQDPRFRALAQLFTNYDGKPLSPTSDVLFGDAVGTNEADDVISEALPKKYFGGGTVSGQGFYVAGTAITFPRTPSGNFGPVFTALRLTTPVSLQGGEVSTDSLVIPCPEAEWRLGADNDGDTAMMMVPFTRLNGRSAVLYGFNRELAAETSKLLQAANGMASEVAARIAAGMDPLTLSSQALDALELSGNISGLPNSALITADRRTGVVDLSSELRERVGAIFTSAFTQLAITWRGPNGISQNEDWGVGVLEKGDLSNAVVTPAFLAPGSKTEGRAVDLTDPVDMANVMDSSRAASVSRGAIVSAVGSIHVAASYGFSPSIDVDEEYRSFSGLPMFARFAEGLDLFSNTLFDDLKEQISRRLRLTQDTIEAFVGMYMAKFLETNGQYFPSAAISDFVRLVDGPVREDGKRVPLSGPLGLAMRYTMGEFLTAADKTRYMYGLPSEERKVTEQFFKNLQLVGVGNFDALMEAMPLTDKFKFSIVMGLPELVRSDFGAALVALYAADASSRLAVITMAKGMRYMSAVHKFAAAANWFKASARSARAIGASDLNFRVTDTSGIEVQPDGMESPTQIGTVDASRAKLLSQSFEVVSRITGQRITEQALWADAPSKETVDEEAGGKGKKGPKFVNRSEFTDNLQMIPNAYGTMAWGTKVLGESTMGKVIRELVTIGSGLTEGDEVQKWMLGVESAFSSYLKGLSNETKKLIRKAKKTDKDKAQIAFNTRLRNALSFIRMPQYASASQMRLQPTFRDVPAQVADEVSKVLGAILTDAPLPDDVVLPPVSGKFARRAAATILKTVYNIERERTKVSDQFPNVITLKSLLVSVLQYAARTSRTKVSPDAGAGSLIDILPLSIRKDVLQHGAAVFRKLRNDLTLSSDAGIVTDLVRVTMHALPSRVKTAQGGGASTSYVPGSLTPMADIGQDLPAPSLGEEFADVLRPKSTLVAEAVNPPVRANTPVYQPAVEKALSKDFDVSVNDLGFDSKRYAFESPVTGTLATVNPKPVAADGVLYFDGLFAPAKGNDAAYALGWHRAHFQIVAFPNETTALNPGSFRTEAFFAVPYTSQDARDEALQALDGFDKGRVAVSLRDANGYRWLTVRAPSIADATEAYDILVGKAVTRATQKPEAPAVKPEAFDTARPSGAPVEQVKEAPVRERQQLATDVLNNAILWADSAIAKMMSDYRARVKRPMRWFDGMDVTKELADSYDARSSANARNDSAAIRVLSDATKDLEDLLSAVLGTNDLASAGYDVTVANRLLSRIHFMYTAHTATNAFNSPREANLARKKRFASLIDMRQGILAALHKGDTDAVRNDVERMRKEAQEALVSIVNDTDLNRDLRAYASALNGVLQYKWSKQNNAFNMLDVFQPQGRISGSEISDPGNRFRGTFLANQGMVRNNIALFLQLEKGGGPITPETEEEAARITDTLYAHGAGELSRPYTAEERRAMEESYAHAASDPKFQKASSLVREYFFNAAAVDTIDKFAHGVSVPGAAGGAVEALRAEGQAMKADFEDVFGAPLVGEYADAKPNAIVDDITESITELDPTTAFRHFTLPSYGNYNLRDTVKFSSGADVVTQAMEASRFLDLLYGVNDEAGRVAKLKVETGVNQFEFKDGIFQVTGRDGQRIAFDVAEQHVAHGGVAARLTSEEQQMAILWTKALMSYACGGTTRLYTGVGNASAGGPSLSISTTDLADEVANGGIRIASYGAFRERFSREQLLKNRTNIAAETRVSQFEYWMNDLYGKIPDAVLDAGLNDEILRTVYDAAVQALRPLNGLQANGNYFRAREGKGREVGRAITLAVQDALIQRGLLARSDLKDRNNIPVTTVTLPLEMVEQVFKASSAYDKLKAAGRTDEMLSDEYAKAFVAPVLKKLNEFRHANPDVFMGDTAAMTGFGSSFWLSGGRGLFSSAASRKEGWTGKRARMLRDTELYSAVSFAKTLNQKKDVKVFLQDSSGRYYLNRDRIGNGFVHLYEDIVLRNGQNLATANSEEAIRRLFGDKMAGRRVDDITVADLAADIYTQIQLRNYIGENDKVLSDRRYSELGLQSASAYVYGFEDSELPLTTHGPTRLGLTMDDAFRLEASVPQDAGIGSMIKMLAMNVVNACSYVGTLHNMAVTMSVEGTPNYLMMPSEAKEPGEVIDDRMWGELAQWYAKNFRINGVYDGAKTGRQNCIDVVKRIKRDHGDTISRKYTALTDVDGVPGSGSFTGIDEVLCFLPARESASGATVMDDSHSALTRLGAQGSEALGMMKKLCYIKCGGFTNRHSVMRAFDTFHAISKSFNVFGSLFFTIATRFESAIAAGGLAATVAGQSKAGTEWMRNLKPGALNDMLRNSGSTITKLLGGSTPSDVGIGGEGFVSFNDVIRMMDTNDPALWQLRKLCTSVGVTMSYPGESTMIDQNRKEHERMIARWSKQFSEWVAMQDPSKKDAAARFMNGFLRGIMSDQQERAFTYVMNATKMAVTAQICSRLRNQAMLHGMYFDPVRELRKVGNYINEEVGGIDPLAHAFDTPHMRRIMDRLFFSWQWTMGSWSAGGGTVLTNALLGGDATTPEYRAMMVGRWARMYGWVLFGVPLVAQTIINAFSKAFFKLAGDDPNDYIWLPWHNEAKARDAFDITPVLRAMTYLDAKLFNGAIRDAKLIGAWYNPAHLIPMYTGGNITGRRHYYMAFGKQGSEFFRWFSDPGGQLKTKLSQPLIKTLETFEIPLGPFQVPHKAAGEPWYGPASLRNILSVALPFSVSGFDRSEEAGFLVGVGPVRQGVSKWATNEALVDAIRDYAEEASLRAGRPRLSRDRARVEEILADAARNGVPPEEALTGAKGQVMTEWYAKFYDALPKTDSSQYNRDKLFAAARALRALGAERKNVMRSVKDRMGKQNIQLKRHPAYETIRELVDNLFRPELDYYYDQRSTRRSVRQVTLGGMTEGPLAFDTLPQSIFGLPVAQGDEAYFERNPDAAGFYELADDEQEPVDRTLPSRIFGIPVSVSADGNGYDARPYRDLPDLPETVLGYQLQIRNRSWADRRRSEPAFVDTETPVAEVLGVDDVPDKIFGIPVSYEDDPYFREDPRVPGYYELEDPEGPEPPSGPGPKRRRSATKIGMADVASVLDEIYEEYRASPQSFYKGDNPMVLRFVESGDPLPKQFLQRWAYEESGNTSKLGIDPFQINVLNREGKSVDWYDGKENYGIERDNPGTLRTNAKAAVMKLFDDMALGVRKIQNMNKVRPADQRINIDALTDQDLLRIALAVYNANRRYVYKKDGSSVYHVEPYAKRIVQDSYLPAPESGPFGYGLKVGEAMKRSGYTLETFNRAQGDIPFHNLIGLDDAPGSPYGFSK